MIALSIVYPMGINALQQSHAVSDVVQPLHQTPKTPATLIFISLNLPDKLLKNLYEEAQKSRTPTQLLLTGLYGENLNDTHQKLEALGIEATVDSSWFEKESTDKHPIFMFINDKKGIQVVQGTFSLKIAKERINSK